MKTKILDISKTLQPELVRWRRHLHKQPELSFEEKLTAQFIKEWLDLREIKYTEGWAGHGIVATIESAEDDGTYFVFRADMDALPIQEQNNSEYCSEHEGIMHACGHDVHMTCLLGAIEIISQLKDQLKTSVKFIFQPAEEKLPGGASIMLSEGAIDIKKAKGIIGLHVYPSMETGRVGFRSGIYMASADELYISIIGKGGHAAMPQDTIDPIYIASNIIIGLQEVVSRKCSPTSPCVLSIGKINSVGGATNIIPNEVMLEGTFRAMDETWRHAAHDLIIRTCHGVAESFGGQAAVNIVKGYPVLINNEELTQFAIEKASEWLGAKSVEQIPLRMTSEDFAWYSQKIPGCFFRLGTGNKSKGITSGVHTSTFDVDEDCLILGAQIFAFLALNLK